MDLRATSTLQKGSWKKPSSIMQKGSQNETSSILQKGRRRRTRGTYRGVRMRDGKWVSEIRIPKTNTRIWLGSHSSPEKAAQAYDAALYCIRGAEGQFNFPNNKRPKLADGSVGSLPIDEIKRIAEEFASMDESRAAPEPSPMFLSGTAQFLPDKLVLLDPLDSNGMVACKVDCQPNVPNLVPEVKPNVPVFVPEVGPSSQENLTEVEPYIPVFVPEAAPSLQENIQLDDFVMQDTEWILDFL